MRSTRNRRVTAALTMASAAALVLSACGASGESSEDGAATGEATATTAGGLGEDRGPITFASGKDFTSEMQNLIDRWNEANPGEEVTLLELAASPDDQRTAFVQNFQAKSDAYDVLWSDVVWTSEFAAQGWIEPLDPARFATDDILPAAVDTATYDGQLFGAPFITNGALLFYRTDIVKTPPTTWEELFAACDAAKATHPDIDCYAGQFAQYEGLTVNVSEVVNAAGGAFVGESGSDVVVNSPESRDGLQILVDAFEDGYINPEAITYKEEESRRAFVEGRAIFLRNWPYVWTTATEAGAATEGKVGVSLLPGVDGTGTSTLGGIDLVVSAFSDNKATAMDWIEFMQSEESQRFVVSAMNQASVRTALYDDPELVKQAPYLPVLKESILNAVPRPKTPYYNGVSLAIQSNSYKALQRAAGVDEAIANMAASIEDAVGD